MGRTVVGSQQALTLSAPLWDALALRRSLSHYGLVSPNIMHTLLFFSLPPCGSEFQLSYGALTEAAFFIGARPSEIVCENHLNSLNARASALLLRFLGFLEGGFYWQSIARFQDRLLLNRASAMLRQLRDGNATRPIDHNLLGGCVHANLSGLRLVFPCGRSNQPSPGSVASAKCLKPIKL
jgi:hypothetical protein